MSKASNRSTGFIGEQASSLYLQNKGFILVKSNYSTRFGEIDLIMRDRNELVFVEVKTKIGTIFGRPEEMFTRYKYEKVKRMSVIYLNGIDIKCRIDMVAVELFPDKSVKVIRHYENVIL